MNTIVVDSIKWFAISFATTIYGITERNDIMLLSDNDMYHIQHSYGSGLVRAVAACNSNILCNIVGAAIKFCARVYSFDGVL